MIKQLTLLLLVFIGFSANSYAQFDGFSHEIGIIAGPVAFKSDYGERHDFSTNLGNVGMGIGLVHYLNFTFDSNYNYTTDTYFNTHFKVRTELSYNKTTLKHYGEFVDPDLNTLGAQQLRAMSGSTGVTNVGMQLEFFPIDISEFSNTTGSFAPFASLGGQFSLYNTKVSSSLGPLASSLTKWPKYANHSGSRNHGYSTESKNVWSIVSSVGTRYKLSYSSDLMVDLRFQYFYSDWVDGLNPDPAINKENKANDSIFWLNFGYIYYL